MLCFLMGRLGKASLPAVKDLYFFLIITEKSNGHCRKGTGVRFFIFNCSNKELTLYYLIKCQRISAICPCF